MSRVMVISGLDEGFLYVTFDIIRERVIEVKEFGACAVGSRQQAGGRGQRAARSTAIKSKYVKFP
jgi:hypothetical protein